MELSYVYIMPFSGEKNLRLDLDIMICLHCLFLIPGSSDDLIISLTVVGLLLILLACSHCHYCHMLQEAATEMVSGCCGLLCRRGSL